MKNLSIYLVCILFAFSSCHKEIDEEILISEIPEPHKEFTITNVSGIVFDDEGIARENTIVELLDNSTLTGSDGRFSFNDVKVSNEGTLLTFNAENSLPAFEIAYPNLENGIHLEINMTSPSSEFQFQNAQGYLHEASEGYSIQFKPNSIASEDGGVYNGNVNVQVKYFNGLKKDHFPVPGNAPIESNDLDRKGIVTLGMLYVHLSDDLGNTLNVREGETVQLSYPEQPGVNSSDLMAYSFEETKGEWRQESSVLRQGNNLIVEANHFSFWCIGFEVDFVEVQFRLLSESGMPVSYAIFSMRANEEFYDIGNTYTNKNGEATVRVPVDMKIELIDLCIEDNYMTLGTFSEDIILGDVTLFDNLNFQVIRGRIIDCNGDGVAYSNVKLKGDLFEGNIISDQNGYYEYRSTCRYHSQLKILANNPSTGMYSYPTPRSWEFNQPEVTLEDLTVCKDQFNYFSFHQKCDVDSQGSYYDYDMDNDNMSVIRNEEDMYNGTITINTHNSIFDIDVQVVLRYKLPYEGFVLGNYFEIVSIDLDGVSLPICEFGTPVSAGFAGWGDIPYVTFSIVDDEGAGGNPEHNIQLDGSLLIQ